MKLEEGNRNHSGNAPSNRGHRILGNESFNQECLWAWTGRFGPTDGVLWQRVRERDFSS